MTNRSEVRWQQRLENLGKAMTQLDGACSQDKYSELERAGLVQMFEFSFELTWKTLKDLLNFEGFIVNTPREALRQAFVSGYINESDTEVLLDALEKRNLLTHTYHEKTALEAESLIKNRYAPVLRVLLERLLERRSA